jgi:sulfite exporter TauE/SafE
MWWTTAFLVGFLGSFHCIGMCGPIALALPAGRSSVFSGRLLYNTGRVITYGVLGAVAGYLGHMIAYAGFQRDLSVVAGIIVLLFAILPLVIRGFSPESALYRYTGVVKSVFRRLFGNRGWRTMLLIGMVNGLLPCGFVFLALAAAATSTSTVEGLLYMLLFGAGTVPAMFTLSMAVPLFPVRMRKIMAGWTPYVSLAVAALLIYRGFTLEPAACCKHP